MESQQQVDHRHRAVQEAPRAIGKTLPQRDRQQHQQDVETPFTEILGQVLHAVEQAGGLFLRQATGATDGRFEDVVGHLDQPVHDRETAAQDARPLVRAINAVHAAERRFQPGRARRQVHRQRHQADRQQTAQVHRFLTGKP